MSSSDGVTHLLVYPFPSSCHLIPLLDLTDRYTNAKLLVDELRVGIRACEGERAVPDPAQLGRVLAESVQEERPERARAEKWKEAATLAVSHEGSSVRDLDEFVKKLSELQYGRSTATAS